MEYTASSLATPGLTDANLMKTKFRFVFRDPGGAVCSMTSLSMPLCAGLEKSCGGGEAGAFAGTRTSKGDFGAERGGGLARSKPVGREKTVEVDVAVRGSDGVCDELAGSLTELAMVGQPWRQILDKCSLPEIYGQGRKCDVESWRGGQHRRIRRLARNRVDLGRCCTNSAVAHPLGLLEGGKYDDGTTSRRWAWGG